MIFSGSAVVDWKNTSGFGKDGKPPLVAIYTGHYTKKPLQNQNIASSNDRGRSWTKYAGNPVLYPCRVREGPAFYASVSGVIVKPRSERLATRSFGHPDDSHLALRTSLNSRRDCQASRLRPWVHPRFTCAGDGATEQRI